MWFKRKLKNKVWTELEEKLKAPPSPPPTLEQLGLTSFPGKREYSGHWTPTPAVRPLEDVVGEMLYGVVDPKKKTKSIKTVITYEDGTEQVVSERIGKFVVFVSHSVETPPKIKSPSDWGVLSSEVGPVPCRDSDVITIDATSMKTPFLEK